MRNWFKPTETAVIDVTDDTGKVGQLKATTHHLSFLREGGAVWEKPWWHFTSAHWDGSAHRLLLISYDPALTPERFDTGSGDITPFMGVVEAGINRALVHHQSVQLENGTIITAYIFREGAGTPFSAVTASGVISQADQWRVDDLENQARDAVGLPALGRGAEVNVASVASGDSN